MPPPVGFGHPPQSPSATTPDSLWSPSETTPGVVAATPASWWAADHPNGWSAPHGFSFSFSFSFFFLFFFFFFFNNLIFLLFLFFKMWDFF
jgi:hypothetical protein